MARLLLGSAYTDGAYFLTYHAFECAMTAVHLRVRTKASVSSQHADRIADGLQALETVDPQLAREASALALSLRSRNESLYVGYRGEGVRNPETDPTFKKSRVEEILNDLDALLTRLRSTV